MSYATTATKSEQMSRKRQYIFSIMAVGQAGSDVVHTVGITTGGNILEAQDNALLFAKKRWSPLLGWGQHTAAVMEVAETKRITRGDEPTANIVFQANNEI